MLRLVRKTCNLPNLDHILLQHWVGGRILPCEQKVAICGTSCTRRAVIACSWHACGIATARSLEETLTPSKLLLHAFMHCLKCADRTRAQQALDRDSHIHCCQWLPDAQLPSSCQSCENKNSEVRTCLRRYLKPVHPPDVYQSSHSILAE